MASNIRTRQASGPTLVNVGADNADSNINLNPKVGLVKPSLQDIKKGTLVQRTRDALGDIGNRLTKKNPTVTAGKPLGMMKPATKPAIGVLKATDNFMQPGPAARGLGLRAIATTTTSRPDLIRKPVPRTTTTTLLGQNPLRAPIPGLGKPVDTKVKGPALANVNRCQDILSKPKLRVGNENKPLSVFVPVPSNETAEKKEDSKPATVVTLKVEVPTSTTTSISVAVAIEEKTAIATDKLVEPEVKPENQFNNEIIQIDSDSAQQTEVIEVFSGQRYDVLDVDAIDEKNPMLLREYIVDITNYLFGLEKKYPINIRYLEGRQVNSRMRSVLLDWLVEVHHQFGFMPETLYMAAKTLDRYLQKERKITRKQLQLVGVTAMYVAAKFEEVCTPTVQDFSAVSDNAFSAAEVRQMEREILTALDFDLAPPPAVFFLRRFSKAAGVSNGTAPMIIHTLAKYIMELSLIDYTTCHLFPSEQAAASLALSMLVVDKTKSLRVQWTPTLEHYTRIPFESLKRIVSPFVNILAKIHEEPPKLKAVHSKYSRNRLSKVSLIPELNLEEWKDRAIQEIC